MKFIVYRNNKFETVETSNPFVKDTVSFKEIMSISPDTPVFETDLSVTQIISEGLFELPEGLKLASDGVSVERMSDSERYISGVIDFNQYKQIKLKEISDAFNNELKDGHFFSETLQIEVDCRRSDVKNDKQNVDGLIQIMDANNISSIDYKGYDGITTVTINHLRSLSVEMSLHVQTLYQKKWQLEYSINTSTDASGLEGIKW